MTVPAMQGEGEGRIGMIFWFLSCFGPKKSLDFDRFGLK